MGEGGQMLWPARRAISPKTRLVLTTFAFVFMLVAATDKYFIVARLSLARKAGFFISV